MERRVELIREWTGGESIASLAEVYGVARKYHLQMDRAACRRRSGLGF